MSLSSPTVTDERPAVSSISKRPIIEGSHVIKVQPLKKSEMQVRTDVPSRHRPR